MEVFQKAGHIKTEGRQDSLRARSIGSECILTSQLNRIQWTTRLQSRKKISSSSVSIVVTIQIDRAERVLIRLNQLDSLDD